MKNAYTIASELRNQNVKAIFNALVFDNCSKVFSPIASAIMEFVAASTDSFVKDICERFLNPSNSYDMSDKQRWCIAFAFQKVSDEVVTMVIERAMAETETEAKAEVEAEAEVESIEAVKAETITITDIRRISENLDRKQIYIHLFSTKRPVVRTIEGRELHHFTNLRSHKGIAEAKAYISTLINEKYSQPQHIKNVSLSRADEAYFERRAFNLIIQ